MLTTTASNLTAPTQFLKVGAASHRFLTTTNPTAVF